MSDTLNTLIAEAREWESQYDHNKLEAGSWPDVMRRLVDALEALRSGTPTDDWHCPRCDAACERHRPDPADTEFGIPVGIPTETTSIEQHNEGATTGWGVDRAESGIPSRTLVAERGQIAEIGGVPVFVGPVMDAADVWDAAIEAKYQQTITGEPRYLPNPYRGGTT